MIDCECYRFMGRLFYREVSIFEMDKCSFVSLQCYAEHTPPYHRLDRTSKQTARYQYGIHGLKFYNYRRNEFYRSQEELLIFLKKYSGRKNILFGYKGRTIESDLCKRLEIPAINLEHFGIKKYEVFEKVF